MAESATTAHLARRHHITLAQIAEALQSGAPPLYVLAKRKERTA